MITTAKPRYFAALTGLRALLAWNVFMFHYADAPPDAIITRNFIAGGGEVGVSLFFVLSGFLIAYQYIDKPLFADGNLFRYFFRRWTRIYPLFFFISVGSLVVLYFHKHDPALNAANILLHFTFLKGFFQERIFLFIGPAWSLSVEECFYAIAPVMFLFRKKVHLLLQCVIIAAIGIGITAVSRLGRSTDFMHQQNFTLYWTFFGRVFQFVCGIYLALYIIRKPIVEKPLPVATIGGLFLIIIAQLSFQDLHKITVLGSPDALAIAFNDIVLPVVSVLLFYGLVSEASLLRKMLESKIFQVLGGSSFAFYLLHLSPLIKVPYEVYNLHPLVVFIIVQLLSLLLYLGWEHPAHRLLNAWYDRSTSS